MITLLVYGCRVSCKYIDLLTLLCSAGNKQREQRLIRYDQWVKRMCVCERERERKKERERGSVYLRVCVCERERESVCKRECV